MSRLADDQREIIEILFKRTDSAIAADVAVLHPGTALAILTEFSRQVERFDPQLADSLLPRLTAAAIDELKPTAANPPLQTSGN